LKNIEETEAAKKLLQEKRLMGRAKSDFNIPASYSADYFHRGRDYAEKLRRGSFLFPFLHLMMSTELEPVAYYIYFWLLAFGK